MCETVLEYAQGVSKPWVSRSRTGIPARPPCGPAGTAAKRGPGDFSSACMCLACRSGQAGMPVLLGFWFPSAVGRSGLSQKNNKSSIDIQKTFCQTIPMTVKQHLQRSLSQRAVAKQLGVSQMHISRALRGENGVDDETRRRIVAGLRRTPCRLRFVARLRRTASSDVRDVEGRYRQVQTAGSGTVTKKNRSFRVSCG